MRNFIIHLALVACLFASKAVAQDTKKEKRENETFEFKALVIGNRIDAITKEEKEALKKEVEEINKQLEEGAITKAEADSKKQSLAQARAKNIENRVAVEQEKLNQLVKDKVDGKILQKDSSRTFTFRWDNWEHDKKKRDSIQARRSESRTTSQFVFAAGVNNLVTDGAVAHSDYRYWGSHFYEWGVSWNTRLLKNDNLLHLKYGMSLMYNNLRPTDNRYFVENGDQTNLETSPINLKDSRFRNVHLVVPVHLEFDFTKKKTYGDKVVFKTHESVRFGIGGFAGVNIKSKQILKYEDADGNNVRSKTKGDFNTNDFVYGVSTYIGYKETSLYLKYDLSPLFEDNAIDQNNISLGIRFDFN